jgi:hypothetical protein
MEELYVVNSAAFVESEYPATGETYEATAQQEELVTIKKARAWAIAVWSIFLVATLAATVYFAMQLNRSGDDDSDNGSLLSPDSPEMNRKHGKDGL